MTTLTQAFEESWVAFRDAFEAHDDPAAHQALRRWIAAWDRCVQAGELDAFDVAYHEDVRARSHLPLPGIPEANGLEELRRGLAELPDIASRFRFDVSWFRREGDHFVGSGSFRARGRYSGLIFRFPLAVLWQYRGGRIASVDAYASRRAALAALRGADRLIDPSP